MLVLAVFYSRLSAQEPTNSPFFISLDYQTGENKPHREIVKNLRFPYRAMNLKFGWQSIGKSDGEIAYRYPAYGLGINAATFQSTVLGEPVSVFFFASFPQITTKFMRTDLEIELGFSHGINPYHLLRNPDNFATGSSANALFGLYLEQSFHLSPHINFFVSGGFSHYSNGALAYPNLGLNVPSLKAGLRYIHEVPRYIKKERKPNFASHVQWISSVTGGVKKLFSPSPTYHAVVLNTSFYLQTGYKRRIGIGYELSYNEAIRGIFAKRDYSGMQLLTHAVHVSHEFLFGRFTLLTQLGFYLGDAPSDTFYFERIGLGYYLFPHGRVVLNLKAHYIKAEYIEAGFCFDLNFK